MAQVQAQAQAGVLTQVPGTTLKFVSVGNGGVGWMGGRFSYFTNWGDHKFIHFDVFENENLDASLVDRINPQGVIVFDEYAYYLTPEFAKLYHCLTWMYGNIPIVLCGSNPIHSVKPQMECKDMVFHFTPEKIVTLPYFEVSADNNHSLEAPFLHLARKITGNNQLLFVNLPLSAPAEKPERRRGKVMNAVLKIIAWGSRMFLLFQAVSDGC